MTTYEVKETGRRLRAARQHRGMTLEELADQIGCTKDHLSRVERGERGMSIDLLAESSRLLGISMDYLVFGTNDLYRKKASGTEKHEEKTFARTH